MQPQPQSLHLHCSSFRRGRSRHDCHRPDSKFRDRIRTSHPLVTSTTKVILEKHKSMPKQEPKRVLAVVTDLFFSVKLSEAARRNGLALEFVKEGKELLEKPRPSLR
jgi:hypothetical protein